MPNIDQDLARIMKARYGKDVRQSIHDAIKDINDVAESQLGQIEADMNTATQAANQASASATTASEKATEASGSATVASTAATNAANSASAAAQKATVAVNSANEASACVEESIELKDNTEEYYNKVKTIADTLETGINPKGTIEFADLPSVAVASVGDTYHIVDDFVSTSDFMDGGGVRHTANSDVYKTSLGKWDVKENAISGIYVKRDILHLPGSVINE